MISLEETNEKKNTYEHARSFFAELFFSRIVYF